MNKTKTRLLKLIEERMKNQKDRLVLLQKGKPGTPKVEVQFTMALGLVLKADNLLKYYQTDGALNELLYIKQMVEEMGGK